MAARKADRGAASIDCVHERRMRKSDDAQRYCGIGIMARAIAEGRCVKTIVYLVLGQCQIMRLGARHTLTLPIRLAREAATRDDNAAMMLVTANNVPSWPSATI